MKITCFVVLVALCACVNSDDAPAAAPPAVAAPAAAAPAVAAPAAAAPAVAAPAAAATGNAAKAATNTVAKPAETPVSNPVAPPAYVAPALPPASPPAANPPAPKDASKGGMFNIAGAAMKLGNEVMETGKKVFGSMIGNTPSLFDFGK